MSRSSCHDGSKQRGQLKRPNRQRTFNHGQTLKTKKARRGGIQPPGNRKYVLAMKAD
jgi:hypothetical protein